MPAIEMALYSAIDRCIETLDLPVLVPVHHIIMRMAKSILIARRNDNVFRLQTVQYSRRSPGFGDETG